MGVRVKNVFFALLIAYSAQVLAGVSYHPSNGSKESEDGFAIVGATEKRWGIAYEYMEKSKPGAVTGLVFKSCGNKNAYFLPVSREVTVCYELVSAAAKGGRTAADALSLASSFVTYIIFHEFGHALISASAVPVLGGDEDAADQVAAMIVRKGKDPEAWLSILLRNNEMKKAPMFTLVTRSQAADAHAITQQRRANLICWAGADTSVLNDAVKSGEIPLHRARGCADEAARAGEAVKALLKTP